MKGDIVLTHDVEVVEMKDFGQGSSKKVDHDKGHSVKVSAKHPAIKKEGDWIDGFKRAEPRPVKSRHGGYHANPALRAPAVAAGERYYDVRAANAKTANTALARELKGRHLQMIAFGGAIGESSCFEGWRICADDVKGTGLFVASGSSLYKGGPATVLISYLLVGALQYCTMNALGELCVIFPIAGSFSAFSTRFLDPSWGFAMGWK